MSKRRKRISLGTLVRHTSLVWGNKEADEPGNKLIVVGLVVGTWSFDPETNERHIHQGEDPHCDVEDNKKRRGYLVLPSKGGGFLYPFFGALEIGVLTELKN